GLSGHTCDVVDLDALVGRSVLIVGGRQSAFEWTALLVEAGARPVDLVYRHDTPRFEPSDWTCVDALMERTERDPDWYRALDPAEHDKLNARFWSEGRLKLEPWLAARVDAPNVRTWPRDRVTAIEARDSGFTARLESGQALKADFLLLATGYKVDITHIGLLSPALLDRIETRDG